MCTNSLTAESGEHPIVSCTEGAAHCFGLAAAAALADPEVALHFVRLAVFVNCYHQSFYCCVPHEERRILIRETPDERLGEFGRQYMHDTPFANRLRTA